MKVYVFVLVVFVAVASAEETFVTKNLELDSPPEGRITNGYSAATGQFPYQVGLSLSLSRWRTSFCGGSLINENWVLTAAHCVEGVQSATVYLGATLRTKPTQVISVSEEDLIAHENYNSRLIQNDVALIRLSTPAILSNKVKLIDLPTDDSNDYEGEVAVVSGWGLEHDKGNVAKSLNYAYLTIDNPSTCRYVFGRSSVTYKNVCAATPDYISTCQGDSGGPLVSTSDEVQIGIVSYGHKKGCAKGYPVVFTRVSSFVPWIKKVTGLDF